MDSKTPQKHPTRLLDLCLDAATSTLKEADKVGTLNGVSDPTYATHCLTAAIYTLGAAILRATEAK
jgi:hypothetical protein